MNSRDNRRRRSPQRDAIPKKHETPGPRPDTVVAGRIPVLECLKAGKRKPRRLFYLESANGLGAILAHPGISANAVDRQTLDDLTQGVVHQGVVLLADPLPTPQLRDWLASTPSAEGPVVLLDGIEDPQNFGAIVRSAAALGAAAVVIAKDRAAPISPASVKAAAGAMEHVDLILETNLVRALEVLKESGYWIYALDTESAAVIWTVTFDVRTVLVVGSEGEGIRRLVRERADFRVQIPMSGTAESLNASVSAAIALAECARQRWTNRGRTQ